MSVMWINAKGTVFTAMPPSIRLTLEAARISEIKARSTPPDRVSPHIPVAPARADRSIAETPREVTLTASGPRARRASPPGYDRVRIGDAFDVMEEYQRRAHPRVVAAARRAFDLEEQRRAETRDHLKAEMADCGDEDEMAKLKGKLRRARPRVFIPPAFEPQVTPGQVQAGRDYAALTERLSASGVKCASLEALRSGGGSGVGVSEAVARDMRRLSALHARIGQGIAKDKARPSKGGMRSAIRVRSLVDMVCLGDMTLCEVMRRHGWGEDTRVKAVLRGHLCDALDRMRGYDLAKAS